MEQTQDQFKAKLEQICQSAQQSGGVDIRDRNYRQFNYKSCFQAKDFIKWMKNNKHCSDEIQAGSLCSKMIEQNMITPIESASDNQSGFYRFVSQQISDKSAIDSWHSVLPDLKDQTVAFSEMPQKLGDKSDIFPKNGNNHLPEMLFDASNCDLFDAVRPIKWTDPEVDGEDMYDILVIGGGAGGLVTAAQSKGRGAKVCLIERGFLGGDCLNTGCVPSKAFLKSCSVASNARNAHKYGVKINGEIEIDFEAIMLRMREIRAQISDNDSAERFAKNLGVDVFLGHAKFTSQNSVEVNGKSLKFLKACIATGGRPWVPPIDGIENIKYHTSDNIFNLQVLPKDMLIIGSGPIGCELGQGFARLGTKVTMVEMGSNFLPREDPDCSAYLQDQMIQDGVKIIFEASILKVNKTESGRISVLIKENDKQIEVEVDVIMIATGRVPNVQNLQCEQANVEYDNWGIKVNNYLQTSNPDIYAVGDCLPGPKFTHNSDVHARYVVRNALFQGQEDKSKIILPACTYTDPEIAAVGMNEVALQKEGIEYEVYTKYFDRCDRAICESRRGIYKVQCAKGSDHILGATFVGGPSGEMICQITQAMVHNLGLGKLGDSIYPYPTFSESIGHLANFQYKPKYLMKVSDKGIKEGMKDIQE